MILFLMLALFYMGIPSLNAMEMVGNSLSYQNYTFNTGAYRLSCSSVSDQSPDHKQRSSIVSVRSLKKSCALGVFDGSVVSAELGRSDEKGLLDHIFIPNELSKESIFDGFVHYDANTFYGDLSPEMTGKGSAATTLFVDGIKKKIFMAHCGYSPGCLINLKTKEIIYQTIGHTLENPNELSRINEVALKIREGKIDDLPPVSRSFGYWNLEPVDEDNFLKYDDKQLIISDPEIFEGKLGNDENDSVIGFVCSPSFFDNFSLKCDDKTFYQSIKDILCALISNGRSETLSCDLFALMDKNKQINTIVDQVTSKTADFNNLKMADLSKDNVSLIVFKVEKNDLPLDDCDSEINAGIKKNDEVSMVFDSYNAFRSTVTQYIKTYENCHYKTITEFNKEYTFPYSVKSVKGFSQVLQKDRYGMFEKPDMTLFGVFDGYDDEGGDYLPEISSWLAHNQRGLLPYLYSNKHKSVKQNYNDFNKANFPEGVVTRSTAVTVAVNNQEKIIEIAHCGDSFCLVVNKSNGEFVFCTEPHLRKKLTERIAEPDVCRLTFDQLPEDGAIFLLFTDGFSDYFSKDCMKACWDQQFKILKKIGLIVCELSKHYSGKTEFSLAHRTDIGLAEKLFLLMDTDKSVDDILSDLQADNKINWDHLEELNKKVQDNVTILVFEVDKNMGMKKDDDSVNQKIEGQPVVFRDNKSLVPEMNQAVQLEPVPQELLNQGQDPYNAEQSANNSVLVRLYEQTVAKLQMTPNHKSPSPNWWRKYMTAIKTFWKTYPKICFGIGFAAVLLFKVLSMRGFFSRVV